MVEYDFNTKKLDYKYYEYGPGFVFAFASKSMAELRKFRLEVEDESNFFNENIEMHHFVILEGYIPAFTRYAIDSSLRIFLYWFTGL